MKNGCNFYHDCLDCPQYYKNKCHYEKSAKVSNKRWIFVMVWLIVSTILNVVAFAGDYISHYWFGWISFSLAILCGLMAIFVATHKEYYVR